MKSFGRVLAAAACPLVLGLLAAEPALAQKSGGVRPRRAPCYLSSQTSSMRAPLKMLLTMTVNPFTRGSQQVARRS